jgi:CubicO group peptidase (beta-lactamase class C family)
MTGATMKSGELMMRRVLLLIVALLTPALATASNPNLNRSAEVDAAVRQQMKGQRIPGIAVAVVLNGKIIKAKGYGLANVELATRVSPGTIFEAGSTLMRGLRPDRGAAQGVAEE